MTRALDEIVAIDPGATYEAAEVALIVFHVTERTLRRRMKKLRTEGFPGPVSHQGRPRVWAGQALLDWQNRGPASTANVLPFGRILAQNAHSAARKGARRRAS